MWHLHRTIHESIVKNAIHTICYYLRIYYLLPNLSTKCLKMMKPGKVSLYHNWSLRCHKIYGYTYTPQNKSENRVLSGHHIQNHHKHLRSTFSQKAPSQMFDRVLDAPQISLFMNIGKCESSNARMIMFFCAVQVCLCI